MLKPMLTTRGVNDLLIGMADGLKGLPEALDVVFAATTLQTCIVHLICNSLDFASWKDGKALGTALKPIYTVPSAEAASWGPALPGRGRIVPFFVFPPEVRRVIYTTNAIERVHARLRKILKTRGHFPGDEAATKLIWLALRNITAEWSRSTREWKSAINPLAIIDEDR